MGVTDGGVVHLAIRPGTTPEAHVDDVGAVVRRVLDALKRRTDQYARAVAATQGHDAAGPVVAGNSGAVVGRRANQPGAMGPVRGAEIVGDHLGVGVGIGVREVPAPGVVDVAVAVVVNAVASDLPRVHPDPRHEVRMVQVDAGVQHGDDHGGRAGIDVPALRRVGPRPLPLLAVHWVIRHAREPLHPIDPRRGHDRLGLPVCHAREGGHAGRQRHHVGADPGHRLQDRGVLTLEGLLQFGRRRPWSHGDDHLPGCRLRLLRHEGRTGPHLLRGAGQAFGLDRQRHRGSQCSHCKQDDQQCGWTMSGGGLHSGFVGTEDYASDGAAHTNPPP